MSIADVFRTQAKACEMLGSPFTAGLLRLVPDLLHLENPVTRRVRTWPGDASSAGDSLPLRLAGSLHALARTGRDPALSALYPPGDRPDRETLRATLAAALETHAAFLLDRLDGAPQTNEVARSAVLIAAGSLLTRVFGKPLRLLELGASAGLNLGWDRYALEAGGCLLGPRDAGLTLTPEWRGDAPPCAPLRIAERAGVDLSPIDVTEDSDRQRLLSYIWPDQPDRMARAQAAIDIAREHPVSVARNDAGIWLKNQLSQPRNGMVTVVFHTIAWQYFPPETQNRLRATLSQAGSRTSADAPLAHFSMEADGRSDSAALALELWPGKVVLNLGRADFHGRWVDWREPD